LRVYFVFEEFPVTEVIFQNGKRKKKEGRTGQQSTGRCDDNVGIAVPNNNETISGDGNDNVLMRTEIIKEATPLAMRPMLLASLMMVTLVMVTAVTALLTVMVAMTAIMLVTYLSEVKLLVKEKRM
jgi:hypothetical protein